MGGCERKESILREACLPANGSSAKAGSGRGQGWQIRRKGTIRQVSRKDLILTSYQHTYAIR